MSDVLLGIIAASVFLMAAIQVAAIVIATRAARRLDRLADRLEQDIRPIVVNLQTLTADAARATALAAAQVERADRLFADVARRIEQALEQALSGLPTLLSTARDGFTVVGGIRALFNALRDLRSSVGKRPSSVEEEDALFIG